jgi:hypothetical protein
MISYIRYPDFDFTCFVSKGETTIENWLKTVHRYARDGMTTRELYDLRQQTNIFTNDEIGMILHQTVKDQALRPPNGKTAIAVDAAIKYGLSRMYALYAEVEDVSSTTEVFYRLDDALDWLGDDVADRMPELRLGLTKK